MVTVTLTQRCCVFCKIVPRHDSSDFVLLDLANVKSNVS